MKYIIDTDILKNIDLSLAEFGTLLYYIDRKDSNEFDKITESLWAKGYLIKDLHGYIIESHSFEKLQVILAECNNPESVNDRASLLADKLREIYPNGKIFNTNYYYRCNRQDIINKLKTFFKMYGTKYTDEQIINATQKYINSFNGNYAYLKLLKYFIWKDERLKGESVQSLLADFIENENSEDAVNTDWTVELK